MGWREVLFPLRPWWKNLFFSDWKVWVIVFLCVFGSWSYKHDVAVYKDVFENPCEYCGRCSGGVPVVGGYFNVSLSLDKNTSVSIT